MQYQNRYVRVTIEEYNLLRDFKTYLDSGLTVSIGEGEKAVDISSLRHYENESSVTIYTTEKATKELIEKFRNLDEKHNEAESTMYERMMTAQKNESEYFKSMSLWDFIVWKIINRRKDK